MAVIYAIRSIRHAQLDTPKTYSPLSRRDAEDPSAKANSSFLFFMGLKSHAFTSSGGAQ